MLEQLVCYKTLPEWQAENLPTMFQEMHNTKAGTWAKLTILAGSLRFFMLDETGKIISESIYTCEHQPPMIAPKTWHRIEAESKDLRCQLAFFCQEEAFLHKKYHLTATHSEVQEALKEITPCKTLDLGCGRGRNALFLAQQGFDVTAWDHNALSIDFLRDIAEKEQLAIKTAVYDINTASIEDNYDFILSTVVMMFLDRQRIPAIIENMQTHTNSGGYNLIVVAMDSEDYPCNVGFSSPFSQGELATYYQDWTLLKYNEEIGELHRLDANGKRIKLRFATMLARKPLV